MTNKQKNIVEVKHQESQDIGLPTDPRPVLKFGMIVLIISFGGFLAWSFLAPLDEGVPCGGALVVDSKRKSIQHQTGGIIDQILVKDGDKVKEGQVMIRLLNSQSKANLAIHQNQASIFKQQLAAYKPLLDEGYYPRNQYLDLQRQYDDVLLKINLAKEELGRTDIIAPVNGSVVALAYTNTRAVITPGSKIMDIVPEGDTLVIEAQIPPQLIDKVRAGLSADIRFSALNQRTTPILKGGVEWVSADALGTNARPEITFYTARIRLDQASLDKIKNENLVAGMPAEVIIKTGTRTFWSYLIKPLVDGASSSLKER
jgi:protease secretion system membrane fusion protein